MGNSRHVNFTISVLEKLEELLPGKQIHVLLQARGGFSRNQLREVRRAGNRSQKVVFGELEPMTYASLLGSARVILFTYDQAKYGHKSSGRVQDALMMQAIPVIGQGTALVSQVKQAGNLKAHTYEENSAESAVLSIARAFDESIGPLSYIGINDFALWLSQLHNREAETARSDSRSDSEFMLPRDGKRKLLSRFVNFLVRFRLLSP